jgi:hypothetical protein
MFQNGAGTVLEPYRHGSRRFGLYLYGERRHGEHITNYISKIPLSGFCRSLKAIYIDNVSLLFFSSLLCQ